MSGERRTKSEEEREHRGRGNREHAGPGGVDPAANGEGLDGVHDPASAPPRPKLLLLITIAEVGGAQAYVASLLPALVERFDVAVAAHGDGPLRDAAGRLGVRFLPLRHVRRAINPWRDALGALELVRLLRRERPDILHASSSKAGVLGRLAAATTGVPIRIFTVHGWAFTAHSGMAARLYRVADRLVRPLTTVTICVAEHERATGLAARTCSEGRTVVIPNAIDSSAVPRTRRGRRIPQLVAVGRLKAPKDFVTLVRAVAELPQEACQLLIVGEGPDRPRLEAEIDRLSLDGRVRLAGERDDVPDLLAEADVFVLSSASEGMPMSVLEAMAAGLPVVASRVGGIPELVADGETGLLIPPGRPDDLAEALRRVLGDSPLRQRLGDAGRIRVRERFDLASFRRAHVELYSRELASRRLPAPRP
jgi:glycosyltransferase involved in cell wall biosynthesis